MIRYEGRDILRDPEGDDCVWPAWAGSVRPEPCENCGHPVKVSEGELRHVVWVEHGVNQTGEPHSSCMAEMHRHTPEKCRLLRGG